MKEFIQKMRLNEASTLRRWRAIDRQGAMSYWKQRVAERNRIRAGRSAL